MSRTFRKDKYGNKVKDYQNPFYKCKCESCTKQKYKLRKQLKIE